MARERNLKMLESESTTVLERDAEFEGKLTFEGTVQINGKFQGEIFSDGVLVIGEGAEVRATIDVGTAIITGTVLGSIRAKQKIEMLEHAKVYGDILSPALVVGEGALFEGHCSMGKTAPEHYAAPTPENNAEVFELTSPTPTDYTRREF